MQLLKVRKLDPTTYCNIYVEMKVSISTATTGGCQRVFADPNLELPRGVSLLLYLTTTTTT